MRKVTIVGAVMVAAVIGGGVWVRAQVAPKLAEPPVQIISGADFGFRVDSVASDGTPVGKIVVRQKGEWIEVRLQPSARRISVN